MSASIEVERGVGLLLNSSTITIRQWSTIFATTSLFCPGLSILCACIHHEAELFHSTVLLIVLFIARNGFLAVLDTGLLPLDNVAEAQPTRAATPESDIALKTHNMERRIILVRRVEAYCQVLYSSTK